MIRGIQKQARRRGVVLLIVMAMLALFASVGLTFVFYAESNATIAATARQGETQFRADLEAELLMNHFLGQFLYDTDNEFSSLRGWSQGRLTYGEDPTRNGRNAIPYNGPGMVNYDHTFGKLAGVKNVGLINKTRHMSDGFTLMPEWYGVKEAGKFIGGGNPTGTYPSLNNPFLAAVNANGDVLIRSFDRPWNQPLATDPPEIHKYYSFRPHPSYHPQFPPLEDGPGGGDVKNLPFGRGVRKLDGTYSVNDSIWMYTGFPVMTAGNGRKYTVLFAPLIIDLDNRINLMVHGNIRGVNFGSNFHVSNQGWGRWEVNPIRTNILTIADLSALVKWRTGLAPAVPISKWALTTPFYSRFDFDAATNTLALPGSMTQPLAGTFTTFPRFPGVGWDSRAIDAEVKDHPAGQSLPKIHSSHMEAILRGGGKGTPALTSELFKVVPSLANPKLRNLVTTLSQDFKLPGMVPYVTSTTQYQYLYDPADAAKPRHPLVKVPHAFPDPGTTPTPGGEFNGTTYASKTALLKRINLNRPLADYPPVVSDPGDNNYGLMPAGAALTQAETERQKMAKELFDCLLLLTGAKVDPKTVEDYRAARWLAQLAVNIVDYLDNDDYMTPFNWNGTEILYGTELPRVVLNEVYAQYDLDPDDPGLGDDDPAKWNPTTYRLLTYIELLNPFNSTQAGALYPRDSGNAHLRQPLPPSGGNPPRDAIYRVVLSRPDPDLRLPENHTGKHQDKLLYDALHVAPARTCILDDWPDDTFIEPNNGAHEGGFPNKNGFFVAGPDVLPGKGKGKGKAGFFVDDRNPGIAASYSSPYLVGRVALDEKAVRPTILLQRLANPHRPYHVDANPYITVDYVDNVFVNDQTGLPKAAQAVSEGFSVGRRQPYAAALLENQNPVEPVNGSPRHTFFRHNYKERSNDAKTSIATPNTIDHPFDWLTHLDRPLVNPIELAHVSTFRPHELTREFIAPGPKKFHHRQAWLTEETLIYRLLEMVYTREPSPTQPEHGRVAGNININTIWDVETFRAICDANSINSHSTADIDALWAIILGQRTPGPDKTPGTGDDGIPFTDDRPFAPFSIGVSPAGTQYFIPTGLNSTLLREKPGKPGVRLFDLEKPNRTHPYQQLELLTKIHNTLTTRSNVYAVWVTAGFFEVDDSVNPPRIGREIGKDDNRHVRHKFFAIVDRTEMRMKPVDAASGVEIPISFPKNTSSPETITMNGGHYDTAAGTKWNIEDGALLIINPDMPNEEPVVVKNATKDGSGKTTSYQFDVTQSHNQGEPIICRCWPGPWPMYDVRKDARVVPFFTVVD